MQDLIDEMKKSNRLKLSRRQMVWHFFPAFFVILIALIILYFDTVNNSGIKMEAASVSSLAAFGLLVFSILIILHQINKLKFNIIPGKFSREEYKALVAKTSAELDWIIEIEDQDYIFLTTEFRWTNWGTLITIIRDEDRILINSICDLHNRPATTSWGQNRKNVEVFKKHAKGMNLD